MCGPAAATPAPLPNANAAAATRNINGHPNPEINRSKCYGFQMPLHYPRYKKIDYEKMPEWRLDYLLGEYGLPVIGDLHQKRNYAMGAFLWPDSIHK